VLTTAFRLSKLAQAAALSIYVRRFTGSNLGRETPVLAELFSDFSQSVLANGGIVLHIRLGQLFPSVPSDKCPCSTAD
jgi:hypothetical protein